MKKLLIALLASALAETAPAAIPYVLAYRGTLHHADGQPFESSLPQPMTFSLYDSARTNQPALWTQSLTVRVEKNGAFYAELEGRGLAEALAKVEGTAEIGVKPGTEKDTETTEFPVRQRIQVGTRAIHAVVGRNVIEANMKQGMAIQTMTSEKASVKGDLTVEDYHGDHAPIQLRAGNHVVGRDGSSVTLAGGVSGAQTVFSQDRSSYAAPNGTPCDMVVTYETDEGAFSLVLPRNTELSGETTDKSRTVSKTLWGKEN